MPSPLTRSRAYWNLHAEKVMDQVFSREENTLDAVRVLVEPKPEAVSPPTPKPVRPPEAVVAPREGLLTVAGLVAVLGLGSSLWLASNWQRSLKALDRERDLQLIERLRQIPVASTGPTRINLDQDTSAPTAQPIQAGDRLDPSTIALAGPIPQESAAGGSDALPASMVPAEPLLVGVVHAGGGQGSAIFQLDQLSISASPGEVIGNSGWQLNSVQANGVVIDYDGVQRRLTVGGAF